MLRREKRYDWLHGPETRTNNCVLELSRANKSFSAAVDEGPTPRRCFYGAYKSQRDARRLAISSYSRGGCVNAAHRCEISNSQNN